MKRPRCQTKNHEGLEVSRKNGNSLQVEAAWPQHHQLNPKDSAFCEEYGHALTEQVPQAKTPSVTPLPHSPPPSPNGCYVVKKFLSQGGKQKVYLALAHQHLA